MYIHAHDTSALHIVVISTTFLFAAAGRDCSTNATICGGPSEECVDGLCECTDAYKEEDGTRHCLPKRIFVYNNPLLFHNAMDIHKIRIPVPIHNLNDGDSDLPVCEIMFSYYNNTDYFFWLFHVSNNQLNREYWISFYGQNVYTCDFTSEYQNCVSGFSMFSTVLNLYVE